MLEKDKFNEVNTAIKNYWDNNYDNSFDINNPIVRLHEPTFNHEEISIVTQLMLETKVTMGKHVVGFEEDICKAFGFSHGVSNNSGSSANLLMIAALVNPHSETSLQRGDEVIIPALTWSTSLWPLVQYGLVPYFVDSDINTLNIDIDSIVKAITPKTKAIMCVPIYGNPCDYDALLNICDEYNLILIEDSCESMGAKYKGQFVGSFGKVNSFSFYYSHHITTLEGGVCTTSDAEIADLIRIIRAHGWVRHVENKEKWRKLYPEFDQKFLFVNEGYNLRLTEPQGAMGSLQIPKLSGFIDNRRRNAEYYLNAFSKYEQYFSFQQETESSEHSWFGFIFIIKDNASFTRSQICDFLNENNIETRVIVAGNLARHPGVQLYNYKASDNLKVANYVMENGFSIGVHQSLDLEALEYVVSKFDKFFKQVK